MKRICFILLVIILVSSFAISQEPTVDQAMIILPNGNVGIGTVTPTENLEVEGNVRVNNELKVDKIKDLNDTERIVVDESGRLDIKEDDGNTKISILPNGDVGIGTTNPTANLQVNGTMKVLGNRVGRSLNTNYTAESDGFLVGSLRITGASSSGYIIGLINNIIRADASVNGIDDMDWPCARNTFTMPVRKGEIYRVTRKTIYGSDPICEIYWISFGN